ncbi:hypothetical protein [Bacillus gaemokensis]|uniref:Uncharacterized protein n=1 Tax=Bacillus gaemokensis TaxID=574375 RepID=A0A073KBT5_9BACI|nr:hypothetical protein [Bacillus gaemokensis]KEK23961.1 hypothetical protein BAGA_06005 [Bacillus gaemokensis]KYG38082.1 hypothetical protein AZF08_20235 [Bacillus gaemokensis]
MKYFTSEIEGKKLVDFQKYDASITKFDDRLELVTGLLNNEDGSLHDFITTYFAEYYDASPTQKGWMAEQDAVCKTLELLGTYLLNAKDIESSRKIVYRFWKSQREFNNYKESQNINTSTLQAGMEEGVEVIDMFFSPNDQNYRMDDSQKLYAKDIREIKEIANLQDSIDMMKQDSYKKRLAERIDKMLPNIVDEKDREALKKIRRNVDIYVNRWIKDMADNQVLIKEAIKKPIRFRNTGSSQGRALTNSIELDDEKVVGALISHYEKVDMTSDIGLLIEELDKVLVDIDTLNEEESMVLNLFLKGYTRERIVKEYDIPQYKMTRIIKRIGKKVSKHYVEKNKGL